MIYYFLAKITVDESNPNHVNRESCRLTIEDALTTPDNEHFGIKSIEVCDALSGKTLAEIDAEFRRL